MSKFEYQAKVMASSVYFTPEDFKVLSKLRIIQKNLVHVQGFPDSLADKSLLSQPEYFGQFGKILKLVVVSKEDEVTKKRSNSAYITYSSKEEAAYAVLSIDSIMLDGHIIRAFFGTSKYCIHFLNNVECFNKDKCMFLHSIANENDILGAGSKFGYSEHIKLAKEIINFNSIKTKTSILSMVIPFRTVLPNIKSIYTKDGSSDINNNTSNNISSNISINESVIMNNKSSINTPIQNHTLFIYQEQETHSKSLNCIFKHRDHSRFFETNHQNDNVPNSIISLIDQLSFRLCFFKRFNIKLPFQSLELSYCKKKYQCVNDSWFDFILKNTK